MTCSVEPLVLIVKPFNDSVNTREATLLTVSDNGEGPLVLISQPGIHEESIIVLPEEWESIRSAIDTLMARLHLHTPIDPDEPEETPDAKPDQDYEIDAR